MSDLYVVLNRTEAKFFKHSTLEQTWKLYKKITNPLGRERNKAMQNDRAGAERFRIKGSVVSHAMTGEKDPHEEAAVQFVRKIAGEIKSLRTKNSDDKFIVVADPHICGLLKEQLDKVTLRRVGTCIKKNLGQMADHEIMTYLKKQKMEANYAQY